MKKKLIAFLFLTFAVLAGNASAQTNDEKAEAVIAKAVRWLGGDAYLKIKSQVGRGKFSVMTDGMISSFQSFVDVLVYPTKERTEFKQSGVKTIQTNSGDTGWTFDGNDLTINVQSEDQVDNFKRAMDTNLDNLLRGHWRGRATLAYVGRREASLGTRNDVVKLTYGDNEFVVEFEFADDGQPMKTTYKRTNPEGVEVKEEDRFAQFVLVQGVKTPFIIDHYSGGIHSTRINYESVEYNKAIPDSIFAKPTNPKELKKDLKL
jgi:hypothetical protein